jgi:hypothetical protein
VPEWLWGDYPFEAAGVAVAEQFLQLKDRPTAICIVNDNMAASFVNRLARAGVCVSARGERHRARRFFSGPVERRAFNEHDTLCR